MSEFIQLDMIAVNNTLGECILWDENTQSTWWTDIQSACLYRYALEDKSLQKYPLPGRLCSFGFIENDTRLICAFAEGFALFDPDSSVLEWLAQPESTFQGTRFNDGRVDRQGRFWSGTMVEDESPQDYLGQSIKGSLYCLSPQGVKSTLSAISISNSLCWSPDASTVYFADSPTGNIMAYDFDAASATFSKARVFAQTPQGCAPDGSIIDAEGCLWNAQWGGGKVVRYSPGGEILTEIQLPVTQPTCICLGGPKLDILFISTARENLNAQQLAEQPAAGNVFIYQTKYKGLLENRYLL